MILDHILNAYLSYIYIDVLKIEMQKMLTSFNEIDDFDTLRKNISSFCDSVYNQLFFNYPDLIQKSMLFFDIVVTFEHMIETINQNEEKEMLTKILNLTEKIEKLVVSILKFIDHLTVSGLNMSYSKFFLWMNYNDYFKIDDMMIEDN